MSSPVFSSRKAVRRSEFLRVLSLSLMLAAFSGGILYAQQPTAPAASEPMSPAAREAMYEHIMNAERVAGDDLKFDFYPRCFVDPNYPTTIAAQRKMKAAMEPVKVFDQLYLVGQNWVSSWALTTSQGIIILDTEDNPAEAKEIIEGGLVKLGLDPNQIKYIVITHEH